MNRVVNILMKRDGYSKEEAMEILNDCREEINEAIAIAVNKASKDLNESERENFYRVLFNITDNLENICDSYLQEK